MCSFLSLNNIYLYLYCFCNFHIEVRCYSNISAFIFYLAIFHCSFWYFFCVLYIFVIFYGVMRGISFLVLSICCSVSFTLIDVSFFRFGNFSSMKFIYWNYFLWLWLGFVFHLFLVVIVKCWGIIYQGPASMLFYSLG